MATRSDMTSQHSPLSSFFRNPESGEVVVAQMPNVPLWVFLAATAMRLLVHPTGTLGTTVSVIGTAGLVVWAVLEIIGGDSPFRRVLGAVVVIGLVVGWVVH